MNLPFMHKISIIWSLLKVVTLIFTVYILTFLTFSLKMYVAGKYIFYGFRTIVPEEDWPQPLNEPKTQTLTLTRRQFSSGAIVSLPPTLELTLTLTKTSTLTEGQFSSGVIVQMPSFTTQTFLSLTFNEHFLHNRRWYFSLIIVKRHTKTRVFQINRLHINYGISNGYC